MQRALTVLRPARLNVSEDEASSTWEDFFGSFSAPAVFHGFLRRSVRLTLIVAFRQFLFEAFFVFVSEPEFSLGRLM